MHVHLHLQRHGVEWLLACLQPVGRMEALRTQPSSWSCHSFHSLRDPCSNASSQQTRSCQTCWRKMFARTKKGAKNPLGSNSNAIRLRIFLRVSVLALFLTWYTRQSVSVFHVTPRACSVGVTISSPTIFVGESRSVSGMCLITFFSLEIHFVKRELPDASILTNCYCNCSTFSTDSTDLEKSSM